MLFNNDQFYIMDDSKKVRVLKPDADTYMWNLVETLELPERDKNTIVYADFDEYSISADVLHYNDKLYFLRNKATDDPTWASEAVMVDNHLHVSGPRYAKESGLIWYMQ